DWNRNPVSGGPYVVSDWNIGESIVMDRNPNYYLEGQPYVDRVIFAVVPDPGAQMAMIAKGEAHVQLWPGEVKEVYDEQMNGQAAIQEIPGQWNMTLFFNLSRPFDNDPGAEPPHPVLGDVRVRQAIAHGIEDGARFAQGVAHAGDGTRLRVQIIGYTNFSGSWCSWRRRWRKWSRWSASRQRSGMTTSRSSSVHSTTERRTSLATLISWSMIPACLWSRTRRLPMPI
ncbi:MAG: ABC transporter substrate-binding protein, partial [Caldilinea sp.]